MARGRFFLGVLALVLPWLDAGATSEAAGATYALPPLEYFINKLPPPPRPGSYTDRMDLSDAVARQQGVTAASLASIQHTYLFDVFTFADVLGPEFTPERYPKTAAFFAKITTTTNAVVGGLKQHYQRLRPFAGHPDQIRLLVKNEPGYSYPSGHTTRSRLDALVMAEILPGQRAALVHAAEQVGLDRILAGEHYQSDLEAGRRLAKIIFPLLHKDATFLADLEAVKAAEWSPPPAPSPTP